MILAALLLIVPALMPTAPGTSPLVSPAPAMAAIDDDAPAATGPAIGQGPVVEQLRLQVPAARVSAWLEAERGSWEPWLAQQPGFLDRQLFWDAERQEATLLIRWASRAHWRAIPAEEVARIQDRFEALAREASGAPEGNPFPLVFEGELQPL